jgi:hypothetical protein
MTKIEAAIAATLLALYFLTGCTTGLGALHQQHENREFEATHHLVGEGTVDVHWEANK